MLGRLTIQIRSEEHARLYQQFRNDKVLQMYQRQLNKLFELAVPNYALILTATTTTVTAVYDEKVLQAAEQINEQIKLYILTNYASLFANA